ncbi:MAG TPA: hypothetical protein PLI94_02440 [Bacillota bacterium]|nr:hypothetical protein [Bacillota bacterium]
MEPKKRIHFMINEAKGWLDLAQESYENDNPVRGELNLHLAQAEIQRACETSREMIGKNMFEISKSRREQQPTWLRYYSLGAVAAMVGILFYMGINLLLFSDGQERTGRSLISASWTAPVQFSWLTEEFFEEEHAVETPHGQSQAVAAQTQRRTSQKPRLTPRRHGRPQTVAAGAHAETKYNSNFYDLHDSRYYSLPGSMENNWHKASVSNWEEERIDSNSVPSFSER